MVPAGWAAFPSAINQNKNCQQTCSYTAKTQSSFVAAVQQVILNLIEASCLCVCVHYSPAYSSVIQKPGYICFVCIVSAHKLNIALHVRSVLKEMKCFIQLQIKLILGMCSVFYGPIILKKLEVGRRTSTCKCWYLRRQPFVCFFQACLDCVTAIAVIQEVVSIRLQKDGYQLCFIFEVKRCFLVEIWVVEGPLWLCWLSDILKISTNQSCCKLLRLFYYFR